jgi:3-hydroxybutyryl-CoA dehydrogenase
MDQDNIQSAAVLGAGTMGHGIAHVLASIGVRTRLYDVEASAAQKGLDSIAANLSKGVEKGKVTAQARDAALQQLTATADFDAATAGVDLVVEAVPEILELKCKLFERLSRALSERVLLASNTSSLPVSKIAAVCAHPERVLGLHFFNPVHLMKLVEVVRAEQTSEASVQRALALAQRMGKDPILVRDTPGFASSRLGLCIGLEAMRMFETSVASAVDIDKAMVLGYGFPMGPLKLTDLVGLDVRLGIAEHLERELGARFEPPRVLREMVAAGKLGKKSGQGFYAWPK